MKRRKLPLIGSALFILIGMLTTAWGPTHLLGRSEWALPYDLWGTLNATVRLSHGNIGGIYAPGTGLISLPGAAVILLPCAALINALGLSLHIPGPHNLHPAVWLLAGPYQMALSCVVLFATDALAERLGVRYWKRALLQAASLGIMWSPSPRWGHPEDTVAVGLLLYAILAQSGRPMAKTATVSGAQTAPHLPVEHPPVRRWPTRPDGIVLAGWLTGLAICVQPLVLLALPVQLALLPWRRMVPFLVRGAVPSAVLLAAAAIANWHDTYLSVTSQPNSPVINHPTIWTSLAPQMANQNVAAGPFRLATIVLACLCAIIVRRRWQTWLRQAAPPEPPHTPVPATPSASGPPHTAVLPSTASPYGAADKPGAAGRPATVRWPAAADPPGSRPWPSPLLAEALWWVALALALRSFFEPVMVSYYPWPPMAVALIPAATMSWRRLWAAALLAGGLTAAAQGPSHAVWIWWVPLVAGLAALLAISRPKTIIRQAPLITTTGT